MLMHRITLGLLTSFMIACGSNGGGTPSPGTAGTTGAAGSGTGAAW